MTMETTSKSLPSLREFESASRDKYERRTNKSRAAGSTSLQRVLGPGRLFSVGIWPNGNDLVNDGRRTPRLPEDAKLIDYPTQYLAAIQPRQIGDLLISHEHPDHFPYLRKPEEVQKFKAQSDFRVHMYWETQLMLTYLNREMPFQNISYFTQFEPFYIPALGYVIPIPFSHNSLHMFGFFIPTFKGETILVVPDQADGERTDRAYEYLGKEIGSQGIDFLITDATNLGRETLSISEHLEKVKAALKFTENETESKVAAAYLRAGDYGLIMLWLKNHLLDNYTVFGSPKLTRFLRDDLHWIEKYGEKFGLRIESLEKPKEQIMPGQPTLVFYDDPHDNPLEHNVYGIKKYTLIDTSLRHPNYRADHIAGIFPVGMSGHSTNGYRRLLEITKPRHLAVSHPPLIGKDTGYRHQEWKLDSRGKQWKL